MAYRLTARAEADVDAIADFIAADSIDAAVKVVLAFEDAFALLASRRGIGHSREDLTASLQVLGRVLVPRGLRPSERTAHDRCGAPRRTHIEQILNDLA